MSTTEAGSVSFNVIYKKGDTVSNISYEVENGMTRQVDFDLKDVAIVSVEKNKRKAVKVETEENKKISIYVVNDVNDPRRNGYVAIPCDALTDSMYTTYKYGILSAPIGTNSEGSPTHFFMINCEPNIIVEVQPAKEIKGIYPENFKYRTGKWSPEEEGSTLLLSQDGLTGTIVESGRPFLAFSGLKDGYDGSLHMVEQLPPHVTWGYNYFLIPLTGSKILYQVLTVTDQTEVKVTCTNEGKSVAPTQILSILNHEPGQNFGTYSQTLDAYDTESCSQPLACSLQANKPVLVAQYSSTSKLSSCKEFTAMNLVPPNEQYLNDYTIKTMEGDSPRRYIGISVHKRFFNSESIMIKDNNNQYTAVASDPSNWSEIYCENNQVCGYYINYAIETHGDLNIKHQDINAAINILVYGFQTKSNSDNSYAYAGGFELQHLSGENPNQYTVI